MRNSSCLLTTVLLSGGLLVASVANAVDVALANTLVTATSAKFSMQPPVGWVYRRSGTEIAASRDGFLLNSVTVALRKHKKAFASLKKDSAPDALPEELADNYVADLKLQAGISDVNVAAIEPAELVGQPAFKVRLTYRIAPELGGATYEEVTLGTPLSTGLLIARYAAPQLNFFAKSLPAFEESMRTLTVASVPPVRK